MIDKNDAIIHNNADQDHDADRGHERKCCAGRGKKQEHTKYRKYDGAENDREWQQHRLEQCGHDKEDAGNAEQDVRQHHLLGFVLALETSTELPAIAGRQIDL